MFSDFFDSEISSIHSEDKNSQKVFKMHAEQKQRNIVKKLYLKKLDRGISDQEADDILIRIARILSALQEE